MITSSVILMPKKNQSLTNLVISSFKLLTKLTHPIIMKRSIALVLSLFILVVGMAPVAYADSASAIKSRMAQRLSQIVSLKKSGKVGENNQGYLTVRGSLSAAQAAMVKAENADRRAVYQMIAAKTKKSVSYVGKARAAIIRKTAPKGTWVQNSSGIWKKM